MTPVECTQWVKQLLQRGNTVVAGVRQPDNASALRSLKAQHKEKLSILPLDVADLDSIADWSKNLKQEVGNIDVRASDSNLVHSLPLQSSHDSCDMS